MAKFSIQSAIGLSFSLHAILLGVILLPSPPSPPQRIALQPDWGSHLQFRVPQLNSSVGESSKNESTTPGGTDIRQEVDKFLKNLKYPEGALERNLESDCEWVVKVAEKGKVEILEESRKCKYRVFDSYFRKEVENWDFQVPNNTMIRIPVRFRINRHEQ